VKWRPNLTQKRYILVISILILFLCAGCGRKGLPVPERLPVPGGIKDLSGEVKDGVLFLSFTMPQKDSTGAGLKDLGGFRILKSCGSCMEGFEPFREIVLAEGQGYTIAKGKIYVYDDDLKKGFQYSYRVHPVTRMGTAGEASNIFSITWQTPPDPPAKVTVKGGDGRVDISWSKEGDLLYNVYRVKDKVYPLFAANSGLLSVPVFVEAGLENGKTYHYEIRSVRTRDGVRWEGPGIAVAAATIDRTPPKAPVDIKTERKGRGVLVTWGAVADGGIAGYNVYRIGGGKVLRLNEKPVKETFFPDKTVPDVRYVSYYVTAVDTAGNESEGSKESIIILTKE
jgi:hypothetical protein